MVALGVLSIGAVVFVSQLFKKSGPDRSEARSETLAEDLRRLKESSDARNEAILRRLDQIESTVRDIQQRISALEAMDSRSPQAAPHSSTPDRQTVAPAALPNPGTVGGPSPVQEALTRGWAYVAKHEFDPKNHERVLSDLVAAYGVRGLSPEVNNSLSATIQQVNEIGVDRVISDVRSLPASDAVLRLRTFVQITPRLTQGQSARIKSTLAAYTGRGPK
jgi:hypothetical protein